MKKKIIFSIVLLLFLIPAVSVIIVETNPPLKDPYGDNWFREEIRQIVIDHIREKDGVEGKIQISEWKFTDFNHDIEVENRKKEDKEYPFKKLEVTAETRNNEYIVYFEKDSNGNLRIEGYEKKHNFNPMIECTRDSCLCASLVLNDTVEHR